MNFIWQIIGKMQMCNEHISSEVYFPLFSEAVISL